MSRAPNQTNATAVLATADFDALYQAHYRGVVTMLYIFHRPGLAALGLARRVRQSGRLGGAGRST